MFLLVVPCISAILVQHPAGRGVWTLHAWSSTACLKCACLTALAGGHVNMDNEFCVVTV